MAMEINVVRHFDTAIRLGKGYSRYVLARERRVGGNGRRKGRGTAMHGGPGRMAAAQTRSRAGEVIVNVPNGEANSGSKDL